MAQLTASSASHQGTDFAEEQGMVSLRSIAMPTKKTTKSAASSSRGRSAKTTTNHETIRRWVEKRGAHPATVKGTTSDTTGVLRIDFPGYSGQDTLKEVSWDDFFKKF